MTQLPANRDFALSLKRFTPWLVLLGLFIASCDIPTKTPNFSFETDVQAPLLFEKSFVLLGPSDDGKTAIIDTTREGFASLFEVGGDGSIAIVHNFSDFDLDDLSDVIPSLSVDPVVFSTTFTDFADQNVSAGVSQPVGVLKVASQDLGESRLQTGTLEIDPVGPIFESAEVGLHSVGFDNESTVAAASVIPGVTHGQPVPGAENVELDIPIQLTTLGNDDFPTVTLARIHSGYVDVTLTNRLGISVTLTGIDVLNGQGQILGVHSTPEPLAHTQSATITIPLQPGTDIEQDLSLKARFSWAPQTANNPQDLITRARGREIFVDRLFALIENDPLPYRIASDGPFSLGDSFSSVTLAADSDPSVNIMTIGITNNMRFPLEDGYGGAPGIIITSGGKVINPNHQAFGSAIAPGASAEINIDLSGKSIENSLAFELLIGVPPAIGLAREIQDADGVSISVATTPLTARKAVADIQAISFDLHSDGSGLDGLAEQGTLTTDNSHVNAIVVELENRLQLTLTDGTLDPSNPPRITLMDSNRNAVSSARFDLAPGPWQTATARLDLSGTTITSDLEFDLDIGTPGGSDLIFDGADEIILRAATTPLHFTEAVAVIEPNANLSVMPDEIILGGEVDFRGIVIADGVLRINVTNRLPIALSLTSIKIRNLEPVGSFPAGHQPLGLPDMEVPANSERMVSVSIDAPAAISSRITLDATASTPGSAAPVPFSQTDEIDFTIDADVGVDQLFFVPQHDSFTAQGTIPVDTEVVRFDGSGDFVELASGTLELSDITNGLDIGLNVLSISVPNIRRAPFGPGDTLTVSFLNGAADQPSDFTFSGINANSAKERAAVALDGMRIYPEANALTYHIHAITEDASGTNNPVRQITSEDNISATISAQDLSVSRLEAIVEPISAPITGDSNGNGMMDIMNDGESIVAEVDGLSDLGNKIKGLSIKGAEFAITVRTSLTVDAVLYAAIAGIDSEGNPHFLTGKAANAVSSSDTAAAGLTANGTSIVPSNMIKFHIPGASDPAKLAATSVMLNAENSNVDQFLSSLPAQLRLVGKILINPSGGRVTLVEPFELDASLGLRIPANIVSSTFALEDTLNADFSSLKDLTDPRKNVTVGESTIRLTYRNGLPLGAQTRLTILDGEDRPLDVLFPGEGEQPLALDAAPKNDSGFADGERKGMIEFKVSGEELERMASGRRVLLQVEFNTDGPGHTSLRTTDGLGLRMNGEFNLKLSTGG